MARTPFRLRGATGSPTVRGAEVLRGSQTPVDASGAVTVSGGGAITTRGGPGTAPHGARLRSGGVLKSVLAGVAGGATALPGGGQIIVSGTKATAGVVVISGGGSINPQAQFNRIGTPVIVTGGGALRLLGFKTITPPATAGSTVVHGGGSIIVGGFVPPPDDDDGGPVVEIGYWFMPPNAPRERVADRGRVPQVRSRAYRARFLTSAVGVDFGGPPFAIEGVEYPGGRWHGPLSFDQITAITAAGYGSRIFPAEVGKEGTDLPAWIEGDA